MWHSDKSAISGDRDKPYLNTIQKRQYKSYEDNEKVSALFSSSQHPGWGGINTGPTVKLNISHSKTYQGENYSPPTLTEQAKVFKQGANPTLTRIGNVTQSSNITSASQHASSKDSTVEPQNTYIISFGYLIHLQCSVRHVNQKQNSLY